MTDSFYYSRFPIEIEDRLDFNYNDPKYDIINSLLSKVKYPIVTLGEPKYLKSITKGKTPRGLRHPDEGIPFIGSAQIHSGSIDLDDAPKIPANVHNTKLLGSQIKKGNVLITMAGAIGRSAAYTHNSECNANQAIAILDINQTGIDPEFLAGYLNSKIGQLFFRKIVTISSQPNINFEQIKQIKLILPNTLKEQISILNDVKAFKKEANCLLNEAKEVQTLAKKIMFSELGINLEREEKIDYYAHFFDNSIENQLSFGRNHPSLHQLYQSLKNAKYDVRPLRKLVTLNYDSVQPYKFPEKEYTYIGLENIESGTGRLQNVQTLKGSTIYSKASILKKKQLLFSGLRPYLNKCFILTDFEEAIGSAELFVCDVAENVSADFLKWYLLSEAVLRQTKWILTGASYPRLDESDFLDMKIVIPEEFEEQERIAKLINTKIMESELKEQKAKDKMRSGNKRFEQLILNLDQNT